MLLYGACSAANNGLRDMDLFFHDSNTSYKTLEFKAEVGEGREEKDIAKDDGKHLGDWL